MAQKLYLLRHGDAEPHGTRPDPERRLTAKGEEQSRCAGQAMRRLGLHFDACYASPKVRAWETARLALEALMGDPQEERALAGGFDGADARGLLAGHDGNLLLVGHEPDFSQIVHDLTGARVEFKKGGVAGIRMGPSPELTILLRPAELAALAGA